MLAPVVLGQKGWAIGWTGRKDEMIMKKTGYTIRCSYKNYITLEWEGKFVFCLNNDLYYAEEIIYKIEERTGMDFQDIPIKGSREDFQGLVFFNGGWKRDFWKEFPDKREVKSYMNLKKGIVK